MKCAYCGFELNENANFCSNCGAPVDHGTQQESAPEVTAEASVPEESEDTWEMTEDVMDMDPEMTEEMTGEQQDTDTTVYGQLDDDDDEDYDDFAYQERRAKRQARKKKKAREKMILFALIGVILVGALAFIILKSLSGADEPEKSQTTASSVVPSQAEASKSVVPSSVVETEDPNKLSAEELNTAVAEIEQQYDAIMAKRTAGEYKVSAYKDGIIAYWDGDSRISAILAESGTEGSQYARSYFYDENGKLFYADLSGEDSYRLYFKDGKLIRLSYAKDITNPTDVTNYDQADSKEYADWEASALDYSTTLMTEAKAAGIVKSQEEIDAEKAIEEERKKAEEEKEAEEDKKAEEEKKAEEAKKAEEEKKEAEKKEEESSSSGKSSGYIFPDSNSEYLAVSDLKGMSQSKVRLALNEIYARRGAKFDNASNKKYFESKSWYKGTCSKAEAQKKFNKYEKKNVDIIVEYEKSKGWR